MSTIVTNATTAAVPRLPERGAALPQHLLLDIAGGLAAASGWRPHVHHDPAQRRPVRLLATDRYEAWVIGWTAGQGVELHDHGVAAGALSVVEGTLEELVLVEGTLERRVLTAGRTVALPKGLVHDVVAPGPERATSIHVYSPPLTTMTYYDLLEGRPLRTEDVAAEVPVIGAPEVARALHPARRARP